MEDFIFQNSHEILKNSDLSNNVFDKVEVSDSGNSSFFYINEKDNSAKKKVYDISVVGKASNENSSLSEKRPYSTNNFVFFFMTNITSKLHEIEKSETFKPKEITIDLVSMWDTPLLSKTDKNAGNNFLKNKIEIPDYILLSILKFNFYTCFKYN